MEAVNVLMRLYTAMNQAEKQEVILRIGKDAEDSGLFESQTTKGGAASTSASAGGKKRGGYVTAYWMKTATRIDPAKKGMFRVDGDWFKNPADVKKGTLAIVGAKDPKHYWLCQVTQDDSDVIKFESLGKEREIKGLKVLASGGAFGALEASLAAIWSVGGFARVKAG